VGEDRAEVEVEVIVGGVADDGVLTSAEGFGEFGEGGVLRGGEAESNGRNLGGGHGATTCSSS